MVEDKTGTKTCFVIAPIGDPDSPIRKRSDQVMKYIIKPVLEPLGYEVVRADDISEPGIITNQVIQRVVDASLVVADLTGYNPNVFYELAICHLIKKSLVQLISIHNKIPFDVAPMRTIKVDIQDLDSVEEARNEVRRQVQAIEAGELEPQSPITVALNLQALEASDNPQAEALAGIQQSIADLSRLVQAVLTGQLQMAHLQGRQAADWNSWRRTVDLDLARGAADPYLVQLLDSMSPSQQAAFLDYSRRKAVKETQGQGAETDEGPDAAKAD